MSRHVYLCPMRWSDMDAYGHVNNVVFVRYLEEARIDLLLTAAGPAGPAMLADGDEVYVSARTVLVLVDLESGRPRRIGPEDRAWLERFLDV